MLQEHHPLAGQEIAVEKTGLLAIRGVPDTVRFSFRIDPTALDQASKAFGLMMPTKIGDMVTVDDKVALCIGPDEWHLLAPPDTQAEVESAFAKFYTDVPHSLVDISHREVGIEIEGSGAVQLLQSAIAFDIEAMPVGSGCRTIFDKAQIVLIREANDRFHIEVWRSFADHVWGLLQAASHEIELDI